MSKTSKHQLTYDVLFVIECLTQITKITLQKTK